MKNTLKKIVALAVSICTLLSVGCGNGGETGNSSLQNANCQHSFTKVNISKEFLKSQATCKKPAEYYYQCDKCGGTGETTFFYGRTIEHDFTAEVVKDEYLKKKVSCQSPAIYIKSCQYCGKRGDSGQTFTYGETSECAYTEEVIDEQYLKSEVSNQSPTTYYKSCKCGNRATSDEFVFYVGKALKDLTAEEKLPYTPTSLTLTMYDSQNSIYGFTWNTESRPYAPTLQIEKGDALTTTLQEYEATVTEATSCDANGNSFTYYIAKAEIQLDASQTYTYRAYDKSVEVGTETATFQTKNPSATAFTFVHLSDSQTSSSNHTGTGTGTYFKQTLSLLPQNTDFIVHTGDVVQDAQYEGFWKAMLHENFSYLSKIPMMAISGNHETTYSNAKHEIFKHFHYKMPVQASTERGFFYSFVYGNAKFIMLNTNDLTDSQLKAEQYDWLVKELQENTCMWTFVAMHNPMYSVGKYGAGKVALTLQTQLQGIFAQYGVDVVLQGHDHQISRTYPLNASGKPQTETEETIDGVQYSVDPNGVIYVMNGPAGNQYRNPELEIDSSIFKYPVTPTDGSKASSWAEFTIDGNTLKIAVKRYSSTSSSNVKKYHTWGIKKTEN